MNDLRIFEHDSFGKIRTVDIDGNPWFVGKDVAAALGYANTKDALSRHVDLEDKRGSQITTPSGEQTMTIINESGLYSLVMSSKLPTARVFKRWVTSEVLPSIRKTGRYRVPEAEPVSRDDYLKAAAVVASCAEGRLPLVLRILSQAGIPVSAAPTKSSAGTFPGDPDENAVRLVLDFIRDNKARFVSDADGERYGFLRNGGETVFMVPAIVYAELEKAGYSPRKTMRYLAERAVIAAHFCRYDGKTRYTVPKHYGKGNVRCVEIHVSAETVTEQTALPLP